MKAQIKSRLNLKSMIIARLGGPHVGGANSTNFDHYHVSDNLDEPTTGRAIASYPTIEQANKRWFELY